MYPDYKSLPSWNGKKYNTALTAVYRAFAVRWWLDQFITKDKKFSIQQAAAICGNTQQESTFNPCIQGDPHIPGFSNGLQQWNNKRNKDMMQFVVNYIKTIVKGTGPVLLDNDHSIDVYKGLTDQEKFIGQLNFTLYELQSSGYKKALKCLIDNEMDHDLAGKFGHIYEGFGDNSATKRDNYASGIIEEYNNGVYTTNNTIKAKEANPTAKSKIILPILKWVKSPNFSQRSTKIDLVVVHDCEGSYNSSVSWFTNPNSQVSAHYVLKEDGSEATQMVDLENKAWHVCSFNSRSIGIEMAGTASKGFPQAQIQASANITAFLLKKYNLPCNFARGGNGPGYCSHHALGKAGGGHSDPTSNDDDFYQKWGLLIEKAYNEGVFPNDWAPDKNNKIAVVNHDVSWAQVTLNKLNKYGTLVVDGNIGPLTEKAIKAFQKDRKLPITGKLDFETIDTLSSVVFSSPKFKSRRG